MGVGADKKQQQFYQQIRSFTHDFLEICKGESLRFWEHPTDAEIKSDQSPVTELDRRLEHIFREKSQKLFPTFGVIGEEFGVTNGDAEFRWVIDPIDGTMNLVNRIPTFGTIVSLLHGPKPVYGAIDHPMLGIRHDGGKVTGVFTSKGRQLSDIASTGRSLRDAIVTAGAPGVFEKNAKNHILVKLVQSVPNLRIYYDCFAFSMNIQGSVQASVDGANIWDVAAAIALIEGRNGKVVEWSDRPWSGDPTVRLFTIMGEPHTVDELAALIGE